MRAIGSVGLFLRLLTSMVLIASAVLARGSPTAVIILLALGLTNLVLTIRGYKERHQGGV